MRNMTWQSFNARRCLYLDIPQTSS